MAESLMKAVRWIGVRLSIARGFVCFCVYTTIPAWRPGFWEKLGDAVLPYAGDYAYADDPWVKENRAYWTRHGRQRPVLDGGENV